MLLIIRKTIAACRGRMKALVMVIRSKNRHIESLVNVSVAKVFPLSKSVSESLVCRRLFFYLKPFSECVFREFLELMWGQVVRGSTKAPRNFCQHQCQPNRIPKLVYLVLALGFKP